MNKIRSAASPCLVLVLCILVTGCPESTAPELLAELALDNMPDDTSQPMALDRTRGVVHIVDGRRVRTLDLATLQYVEPGATQGAFYAIDDEDDLVASVSPTTGLVRQILAYETPLAAGFATGMAYNPAHGTAFVIDIASPGGAAILFEMDVDSGALTQIGPTGLGVDVRRALCLARAPADGTLYTVTPEDYLFRIDPDTALAEQIGYVGIDFDNIQDLSFSPSGTLYGIHSGAPSTLVTLDTSTGAATRVADLPLGYIFGSLCFKPDGTLWGVELARDALVRIDPSNGSIQQEFPTLVVNLPYRPEPAFEGIDSLAYFPNRSGGGLIYETAPLNDIEGLALNMADGGLLVSTLNFLERMDASLGLLGKPVVPPRPEAGLGPFLEYLVACPATGLVYGRDALLHTAYEIDPSVPRVVRQFHYLEGHSNELQGTYGNQIAVDSEGARLFVQHGTGDLYVVNLATGESRKLDYDVAVEGVLADTSSSYLYLTTSGGFLDRFDMNTEQRVARVSVGGSLGMMTLDPARNRIAVSSWKSGQSSVLLFELENLKRIPFNLKLNSVAPRMQIDPDGNRLLIIARKAGAVIQVYALPE